RVSLFGISALAPVYFEFFRKLGTLIEVWFYYLNPSQEYWSENETRKSAARRSCRESWTRLRQEQNPDDRPRGNPLLTSLGRQGQDFFRYLTSLDEEPEGEQLFIDHVNAGNNEDGQYQYPGGTQLGVLQEDILQNISRNPGSAADDPESGQPLETETGEPDGSVAIHSCHSKLRQVEVLYDQLLALIEKEKCEPRNILVMAPDIGEFEPYIQAVFGGGGSLLQNQYSIADRSKRSQNRCADTLLKVLQLMTGRFEVTAVFDLFENEDLAERVGLSGSELEDIRYWIAELGVHWGIDGEDHKTHCGVNFEEYSWKQALDRLILGYAVAERDSEQALDTVIPFDSAEGHKSVIIGNFVRFLQLLFEKREILLRSHDLEKWCDILSDLPGQLFSEGTGNYQELAALRRTFAELRASAEMFAVREKLDLRLIMYLIEKKLAPTGISEPFLRGKITFCSLMPMRSIPMEVIAVLGLDEQNFPRRDYSPGFNVVSAAGQRAALERSQNSEDRYIFLEALLAARKHLLLFYQGKDPKTNKPRPPAVPLAELRDALDATFPKLAGKWETEHCLQAFDSRYYREDSKLFSYSAENFEGAEAFSKFRSAAAFQDLMDDKKAVYRIKYPSRAANWTVGQEPETLTQTTPKILENFFRNPCQFFLETAAGLRKHYDTEVSLEDSESTVLDELGRYQLRSEILNQIQKGLTPGNTLYQLLKKTNRLPVGEVGKQQYNESLEDIRQIPEIWLDRYMHSQGYGVSLNLDGIRIEGEIPVAEADLEPYVISRSSSIARDLITLRLRHLILCAAGHGVTAHFWNQKEKCCQHLVGLSIDSAKEKLLPLIKYYLEGHHRPLPFFPKAGYSVSPTRKGWQQVRSFRDAYTGNDFSSGDYEDPAVQLIFTEDALEEESPFLEEFGQISHQVFGFAKGRVPQKELRNDD
ncbi:MAG: exonuclease V subunit gamma, partial [Lentisphaerae bacterium]|nr:exonuclease V subunit gamma [Lentisphaerota bacterium]